MKLSLLVPARPNSKFLAHFLMSYFARTKNTEDIELLIMPSPLDTWNKDLFRFFDGFVKFIMEPAQLGQAGHYIYLNELLKHATGNWVLHLCDDMEIIEDNWDDIFFSYIDGLDYRKVYQVVPQFSPAGAHVHGFSRGWLDVTGRMAGYPNTDSWNNTVLEKFPAELLNERKVIIPTPLFRDYSNNPDFASLCTHGMPEVESGGQRASGWESQEVQDAVQAEADKLLHAIANGK